MSSNALTVACPHCGRALALPDVRMRPKPPRPNTVARWWRRRTLRLLTMRAQLRLGQQIEAALLYHWMLGCPLGLAADEDCAADCPNCAGTYRCDREAGHDGDHEEHDDQDRLLHHWPQRLEGTPR